MKPELPELTPAQIDQLIGMAWDDRCSFERIKKVFGLAEKDVITIMRREFKLGSFRRWRRRVTGRVTKHRERFKIREGTKGRFE